MTLAISNVSVVEVVLAIWTGRQAPRDVRKLQATDRLAGVSDAGEPVPQSEATLALMQVIDTVFLDYPAQPRLVYLHYVPADAAGLSVSGSSHGLGNPQGFGLAGIEHHGLQLLRGSLGGGAVPIRQSRRYSTPIRAAGLPARRSPACCWPPEPGSAWMAGGAG